MKTTIYILILGAFALATSCASVTPGLIVPEANYKQFVPVDPAPSPIAKYYNAQGNLVTAPWNSLTNDIIRRILSNQRAEMLLKRLNIDGKISYGVGSITAEKGTYEVTLDYMNYLVEDITDPNNNNAVLGTGRIGVGLRISASIQTFKSGIDLSSLIAIGFAAKQGSLKGQLTVDAIGINSPDITQLFPTPSTIDETSIQKSLEAIAAIKSKLADANTVLTPQIVSIKLIAPNVTRESIKSNLTTIR